jgi:hypothetical protein
MLAQSPTSASATRRVAATAAAAAGPRCILTPAQRHERSPTSSAQRTLATSAASSALRFSSSSRLRRSSSSCSRRRRSRASSSFLSFSACSLRRCASFSASAFFFFACSSSSPSSRRFCGTHATQPHQGTPLVPPVLASTAPHATKSQLTPAHPRPCRLSLKPSTTHRTNVYCCTVCFSRSASSVRSTDEPARPSSSTGSLPRALRSVARACAWQPSSTASVMPTCEARNCAGTQAGPGRREEAVRAAVTGGRRGAQRAA